MKRSNRPAGLLLASPLVLGGCGEMRPAVPLERSVPLAALLLAAAALPVVLTGRRLLRRPTPIVDRTTGWTLPAPPIVRVRVVSLLSGALIVLPSAAISGWLVAFSFAEAHVDIFTYSDVVWFSAGLLLVADLAWVAIVGVACGLTSPSAEVRRRTRVGGWAGAAGLTVLFPLMVPVTASVVVLLLLARRLDPQPDLAEIASLRVPSDRHIVRR